MSKGSGRRPQEANDKHVASEWDRLFGGVQTEDKDDVNPAIKKGANRIEEMIKEGKIRLS